MPKRGHVPPNAGRRQIKLAGWGSACVCFGGAGKEGLFLYEPSPSRQISSRAQLIAVAAVKAKGGCGIAGTVVDSCRGRGWVSVGCVRRHSQNGVGSLVISSNTEHQHCPARVG